jgi:DNA gyrase/topoisomerase IV subunit A
MENKGKLVSGTHLDYKEDILDNVIKSYNSGKDVAVISDSELVEYLTNVLLSDEEIDPEYIDFTFDSDEEEYIIFLDKAGWISAMPLEDFSVLKKNTVVYVDVDTTTDETIDYCCDNDYDVMLFGYAVDSDKEDFTCDGNCSECEYADDEPKHNSVIKKDNGTYKINGKNVSKDVYEKQLNDIDKKLKDYINSVLEDYGDLVDNMRKWKEILGW